ncbi:MAG: prepilin-type cleavage/methylation domain-containing protein [Verrucomicrobiota bacterium]
MRKPEIEGFTLTEIIIIVAIIGLLAAFGIPSFRQARINSIANAKEKNIRIIEAAVAKWAEENKKVEGDPVAASDIHPYIEGVTDAASLTSPDGPLTVGSSVPTLPATVGDTAHY